MKKIFVLLIVTQLFGCAAMEHQRIQAERERQLSELNLPDYAGVNNRNHPVTDFVHGAAWWIGADAAKNALNKALE